MARISSIVSSAAGVGCERVVAVSEYPTSRTVILLVEGEDRRYVHVFGANRAYTAVPAHGATANERLKAIENAPMYAPR